MARRWLTADEQRAWRAYRDVSLLLEDVLDQQLRHSAGMSHLNYSVLVFLSEAPERRLRMTDLAEQLKIVRSRLTYIVSRMEDDGWVVREDCPGDKRGQLAVLTDQGAEVLAKAAPGHVAAVRTAIFDQLDPEQVQVFGEACASILAGLTDPDRNTDLPWRR